MEFAFGKSPAFKKVVTQADRFAQCAWPILLVGETGVGKELIAQRIHDKSHFKSGPFVAVNCGALPPTLIEAELFGHERGAFSGAIHRSQGLVRRAQGGTLFLDEIGDLDHSLQVKLLRLLDFQEVRSVGATKTEKVDLRILAATNKDLDEAVAQGLFRLDLLERLGVLFLSIPPLRERKEDIALICRAICYREKIQIADDAMSIFLEFHWPGNVRQLRNALIQASVCGCGVVSRASARESLNQMRLRHSKRQAAAFLLKEGTLAAAEQHIVLDRLRFFDGNKRRTARALGIAKSTLHDKIKRWNGGVGEGLQRLQ